MIEDTTGVTRSSKSKDRQYNGQKTKDKRTDTIMVKRQKIKGQTMIYKTLNRKLNIKEHEPH
jgi:hypothetical protein